MEGPLKSFSAFTVIFISLSFLSAHTYEPDWGREARVEVGENRSNIYNIESSEEFADTVRAGFIHALHYPVSVTGLYIPYGPLINLLEAEHDNALRRFIQRATSARAGFSNEQEMYEWLGLSPYNDIDAEGIYQIPYPGGLTERPSFHMGASIVDTPRGKGLTFSCATCHSAELFGQSVIGLNNKKAQANQFFVMAKKTVPFIPSYFFQRATDATDDERDMFRETKQNLRSVGAIDPQVLGLDTSLPQVALSLSRRSRDANASKSRFYETFPRVNPLDRFVADSKPGVWWTLKYKTRWLSDGSIVEGNPILTNFLWNELGRGTDLDELKQWMEENPETIKELTAAAFATQAPRWSDFFDPVQTINLPRAKRGEKIFNQSCKECHGQYVKGWSQNNPYMSLEEKIETIEVRYHEKTPVKNVGTDPQRWMGMNHFAEDLNNLEISKWMETVVEPQEGYVPPPLNGIWARYPYFHNNSIPNLCALLTPPDQRPRVFIQGPSQNPETDFSFDCVGYPTEDEIPSSWWANSSAVFDTNRPGLRNTGHYRMLLDDEGNEKYTPSQKRDLIEYLKTL